MSPCVVSQKVCVSVCVVSQKVCVSHATRVAKDGLYQELGGSCMKAAACCNDRSPLKREQE